LEEYRPGVQKQFFDNASAATLHCRQRPESHAPRKHCLDDGADAHFNDSKDGKTSEAEVRYTGIWERRGASWLLVHEHLSVPMA